MGLERWCIDQINVERNTPNPDGGGNWPFAWAIAHLNVACKVFTTASSKNDKWGGRPMVNVEGIVIPQDQFDVLTGDRIIWNGRILSVTGVQPARGSRQTFTLVNCEEIAGDIVSTTGWATTTTQQATTTH